MHPPTPNLFKPLGEKLIPNDQLKEGYKSNHNSAMDWRTNRNTNYVTVYKSAETILSLLNLESIEHTPCDFEIYV